MSFTGGEITQIVIAILGFAGILWRFRRVEVKVEEIRHETNSMKDALVDGAYTQGKSDQREETLKTEAAP
jgi:hypothetical protein